MANIVVCADGTWNRPEEDIEKDHPTNLLKLARSIKPSSNGVKHSDSEFHGDGECSCTMGPHDGGEYDSLSFIDSPGDLDPVRPNLSIRSLNCHPFLLFKIAEVYTKLLRYRRYPKVFHRMASR